MPLYLFSLSHSSPLFLFFFFPPHPYIGLIFTLCLSIFFLSIVLLFSFLTVTYVLMDNFLSLLIDLLKDYRKKSPNFLREWYLHLLKWEVIIFSLREEKMNHFFEKYIFEGSKFPPYNTNFWP